MRIESEDCLKKFVYSWSRQSESFRMFDSQTSSQTFLIPSHPREINQLFYSAITKRALTKIIQAAGLNIPYKFLIDFKNGCRDLFGIDVLEMKSICKPLRRLKQSIRLFTFKSNIIETLLQSIIKHRVSLISYIAYSPPLQNSSNIFFF